MKCQADKTAYILNATKSREIVLRCGKEPKTVEVFDTFGARVDLPKPSFANGVAVLDVPVSGYARIVW